MGQVVDLKKQVEGISIADLERLIRTIHHTQEGLIISVAHPELIKSLNDLETYTRGALLFRKVIEAMK